MKKKSKYTCTKQFASASYVVRFSYEKTVTWGKRHFFTYCVLCVLLQLQFALCKEVTLCCIFSVSNSNSNISHCSTQSSTNV